MRSLTATVLPLAAQAANGRRRAAAWAAGVMLLGLAANLAWTVLGVGSETIANQWGQQLVLGAAVALCALRCLPGGTDRDLADLQGGLQEINHIEYRSYFTAPQDRGPGDVAHTHKLRA